MMQPHLFLLTFYWFESNHVKNCWIASSAKLKITSFIPKKLLLGGTGKDFFLTNRMEKKKMHAKTEIPTTIRLCCRGGMVRKCSTAFSEMKNLVFRIY